MKLSQIFGGGGAGLKLRGAQTYNNQAGGIGGIQVSGLNLSGAGQTVLSLTGKWAIDYAVINSSTNGTFGAEIIVDGETVFNLSGLLPSTVTPLIGVSSSAASMSPLSAPIICESSLTIKITRSVADSTGFTARALAIY